MVTKNDSIVQQTLLKSYSQHWFGTFINKLLDVVGHPGTEGRDTGEHRRLLVFDAAPRSEADHTMDLPGGAVLSRPTGERTSRVTLQEGRRINQQTPVDIRNTDNSPQVNK